ncbi:MAG: HAD family hydrolase [Planctomycetota bacterium]
MPRPPLRAVTLDAYGTLFDLDSTIDRSLETIIEEQRLAADPRELGGAWTRRFFAMLYAYGHDGGRPFRTIRELTAESLAGALAEFGLAADVERGVETWFEHVRSSPLFPEVREAVEVLASRFRVAIVSDADDDILAPSLERAGLPVELVFTSEGERSYKIDPSTTIFSKAFEALGVPPGEAAHVGDSTADVVGACRAGARAVWLSRDGREWADPRAEPHVTARDLLEAARALVG